MAIPRRVKVVEYYLQERRNRKIQRSESLVAARRRSLRIHGQSQTGDEDQAHGFAGLLHPT